MRDATAAFVPSAGSRCEKKPCTAAVYCLLRLESVYELMRRMRTFKNFWLEKMFKRWHSHVRRLHFRWVGCWLVPGFGGGGGR